MNKIDAYKMDGLGNDFIIFDRRKNFISLTPEQIIKISSRNNVGCDQVIFINNDNTHDANLAFFNSNGGEISACGNGSRCVAYMLMKEKNTKKVILKTKAGVLKAELDNNNLVCINMGEPKFQWKEIPLNKEMNNKNLKIKISDKNGEETEGGFSLNVGNPHVIFFVKNYNDYNAERIGPKIENHSFFPEKCNVTFAQIVNKKHIKIKVWERGAGITKACGTAACATIVASSVLNLTERSANIEFKEGLLNLEWKLNNHIYMKGKVSEVKKIKVII